MNDDYKERALLAERRLDEIEVAIGGHREEELRRDLVATKAQLSAVRKLLTGAYVMSSQDAGQVVCATVVEDALALLSPGGGTGVGK